MQLDEIYNFCLKNFLKHSLLTEVGEKTMIFVFYDFRDDNHICKYFSYDIRNQRLKLRNCM